MVKTVYISGTSDLVKAALFQALKAMEGVEPAPSAERFDVAVAQGAVTVASGPVILVDGTGPIPPGVRVIAELQRPFRLAELARLVAGALEQPAYAALMLDGAVKLLRDPPRLINTAEARQVELTEKEAELLALLHRLGEAGAERTDLLSRVWGYAPGIETHTLETHLTRLRRKLEEAGCTGCEITGQQQRYRLTCRGNA